MRRAAKRDSVEPQIREALEACGWTVQPLSIPGGPDLLAGRAGRTELIEVKTGKRFLRENQKRWHDWWAGRSVIVLRDVEQVKGL